MTPSPVFLDVGTCLGQDIRKLIFDGAHLNHLYGAHILPQFISRGYDLFLDSAKLRRAQFLAPVDIFHPTSRLSDFSGRVDVLHANSLVHLFSWEDQVRAGEEGGKLAQAGQGECSAGQSDCALGGSGRGAQYSAWKEE